MKLALFVSGASLAYAQMGPCLGVMWNDTACTAMNNCTSAAACGRMAPPGTAMCDYTAQNASACTASGGGNNCAYVQVGQNATTCMAINYCSDTCIGMTTQANCNAGAACVWGANYCFPAAVPTPAAPCSGTTQATCIGDSAGCFWMPVAETICGVASNPMFALYTPAQCQPCNNNPNYNITQLSALAAQAGKTCTWPAMAPWVQGYSATVSAFAQSSSCPALMNASSTDMAVITELISMGNFINPMANGSCSGMMAPSAMPGGGSSGSSMLSPSAGLLVLVAFLIR